MTTLTCRVSYLWLINCTICASHPASGAAPKQNRRAEIKHQGGFSVLMLEAEKKMLVKPLVKRRKSAILSRKTTVLRCTVRLIHINPTWQRGNSPESMALIDCCPTHRAAAAPALRKPATNKSKLISAIFHDGGLCTNNPVCCLKSRLLFFYRKAIMNSRRGLSSWWIMCGGLTGCSAYFFWFLPVNPLFSDRLHELITWLFSRGLNHPWGEACM